MDFHLAPVDASRHSAPSTDLGLLLERASAGDQEAWNTLARQFEGLIRREARSHGLQPADADDVAQATWRRLIENIGRIQNPEALGAWMSTTARRESLRILQSRSREMPTDSLQSELPAGDAVSLSEERRAALAAALDELPERHRKLMFELLKTDPPSYAELSQTLDMPVGSIGPIRGRSLARLRKSGALEALVD